MRYTAAALLLAVLFGLAPAQERAPLRLLATEQDAWALADADAAKQPQHDLPYLRWLWIESGEQEDLQCSSLDLNEVLGRGTLIVRPVPVLATTKAGAKVLLARLDLRAYGPAQDHNRQKDLEELTQAWEQLAFEPRNSFLFTADTLRFATPYLTDPERIAYVRCRGWKLVDCEPYQERGQTYRQCWAPTGFKDEAVKVGELPHLKDVVVARVFGDHLDPQVVERLTYATRSGAPLVSFSYFHARALTSIRDEQASSLFAALMGGLFYDFSGVRSGFKKGTDLDNLLAEQGIGDVERGIAFDQVFEKLRSDQKVAIFHSGVTDGPREVDIIPSLSGRIDAATRLVRITNDLKRSSVDIGQHPIFNLLKQKPDAHEVFYDKSNGLKGAALFNGAGARQDEAPPDVARDWTQGPPRHGRLAPLVSCIACHSAEGSDNYRALHNDAKTLFKSRLEIFGDVNRLNRSPEDTLDRILGAYTGDPERAYVRGRDDYARAVLRATGPWKASVRGQADVVKLAGQRQVKLWRDFDGVVTPQQALRELGIEAPKDESAALLNQLLPPDKRGLTVYGVLEDPRLAALKAGIPITRMDWALAYSFAAARAKIRLAELRSKR